MTGFQGKASIAGGNRKTGAQRRFSKFAGVRRVQLAQEKLTEVV